MKPNRPYEWAEDGRALMSEVSFKDTNILRGYWRNKHTGRAIEIRNPITDGPKVRRLINRSGRHFILVPVANEDSGRYVTKEVFLRHWEPITYEKYLKWRVK